MRAYKDFLTDLKKSQSFLFMYMDCLVPIPRDFHQSVAAATYFAASENRPVFVIPAKSKKGLDDYHPELISKWTILEPSIANKPVKLTEIISDLCLMPLDQITLGIGGVSYESKINDLAKEICSRLYANREVLYDPSRNKVNQGSIIPELCYDLK